MPSISELGFQNNIKPIPILTEEIPLSSVNQQIPNKSIDLSKMTIDSFLVNQHIRGGASGYNDGIGWWIGRDENGTAKMFFGNSAGNKVTWDGTTLSISGSLIAGEIHIPDTTTADSFHVDSAGNMWIGCNVADFTADNNNAVAYILKNGTAKFKQIVLTNNVVIQNIQSGSEISIQGWQQDMDFSASNNVTVAWGSGTIRLLDGTTYSITGANTGTMAAATYIYLDIAVSTTLLQTTTTAANAVGSGKILLAVAENVADATKSANFQVFGGKGGISRLISADQIVANSITANEMNVSQLSAITADLGSITAGTITLNTSGYIRGGQTDYNTSTGFFLGYSGSAYKFSIGDGTAENSVTWDGSELLVKGQPLANEDKYGDGSDGDVTISSPTTLTSDMFYNNLVVNDILSTGGYRIFVKGTLSGSGTIKNNGGNGGNGGNGVPVSTGGTAGTAGSIAPGNSLPPSKIGVIGVVGGTGARDAGGSAGGNGVSGTAAVKAIGDNNGVSGGAGGRGGMSGYLGGSAGAGGTKSGTILNKIRNFVSAYFLSDSIGGWTNFTLNANGGSGGGGGGGYRSPGGDAYAVGGGGGGSGGSGGAGGCVWISARTITFTGSIEAVGGNGGNGGNGANGWSGVNNSYAGGGGGGGAGGAGGNGGVIIILTSSTTPTYTTSILGGDDGLGGNGGLGYWTTGGVSVPYPTGDGVAGSNGNNGNAGLLVTLII